MKQNGFFDLFALYVSCSRYKIKADMQRKTRRDTKNHILVKYISRFYHGQCNNIDLLSPTRIVTQCNELCNLSKNNMIILLVQKHFIKARVNANVLCACIRTITHVYFDFLKERMKYEFIYSFQLNLTH